MRQVWLSSLVLWISCSSSHTNGEKASSCLPDSLMREVQLSPAWKEALPVELRVPGEVASLPERTVELRSPVRGTLTEVYVRAGQEVVRGMPLLRVRSPDLLEWESRYRAVQAQAEAQRMKVQALERMVQDSLVSLTELSLGRAELYALQAEGERLAEQLQLFRRQGADFLLLAPRSGTVNSLSGQ